MMRIVVVYNVQCGDDLTHCYLTQLWLAKSLSRQLCWTSVVVTLQYCGSDSVALWWIITTLLDFDAYCGGYHLWYITFIMLFGYDFTTSVHWHDHFCSDLDSVLLWCIISIKHSSDNMFATVIMFVIIIDISTTILQVFG